MLKNKSKLVVLLITVLMLISTISFATTDNTVTTDTTQTTEETTTTTEQEIYNGDLYLFDTDVTMDQLVDGNVFIIGNNVNITGRVNGSLFVVADNVTLAENSYIVQTFYVCANQLTLNGAANDLYAACSNIDMAYESFMIRDLRAIADTINFNGGVGRDAFVTANNFNFVTETDKAGVVYGNLTYSSNNELALTEELVQGTVNYSRLESNNEEQSVQEIILDKLMNFGQTLLYTVVVFLLSIWLAPKFVEKTSSFIGTKSLLSFGLGALACVAVIVLSFALLCSYIGVPLAIAIIALLALMLSISFATATISITTKIKEKFKFEKKYLTYITLFVVTLILWALQQIPYAGEIVSFIITLFGFGVLVLSIVSKNTKKKDVEVKE